MRNLWKRAVAVGLAVSIVLQGISVSTVVVETVEAAEAVEVTEMTEESVVEETVTEVTAGSVSSTVGTSDDKEIAVVVDSGTCGENLSWVLDSEGILTISGIGDMEDYDSGSAPWYG